MVRCGQGDDYGGAFAKLAFHGKRSAVGLGNAAAQGQAQAAAALAAGTGFIHHIKRLHHAGQLVRRDALAVVLNRQPDGTICLFGADRNGAAGGAGLGGVGDKVDDEITQQVGISLHGQAVGLHGQNAAVQSGGNGAARFGKNGIQLHGYQLGGVLTQAHQLQQLSA